MRQVDREKVALLLRLRQLVGRKYELGHDDLLERLGGFYAIEPSEVCPDDEYRSLAFRIKGRLDRTLFEHWLLTLPKEVLRVKGFVLFEDESGFFEVQWSNAHYNITPMPTGRWMDAVIVVISHPLSGRSLVSGFKECIV